MCRLTPTPLICLLACGLAAVAQPASAQQARPGKVTLANPAAQPAEQRPAPQALRVPAVNPALLKVLQDWHNKTKTIEKLQGEHERWTYEPVFAFAKCSEGKFYYESPDKGRIDLAPRDPATVKDEDPAQPGVQTREPGTGQLYTVKLDKPERWICDGSQILRVDDSEKLYEVVPIPPAHQGKNIMDGPLPFLFGLPPQKALEKYKLTLKEPPAENTIWLEAWPLLRSDAALWQRADVLLDSRTFLPIAVKLFDLTKQQQGVTLYTFKNTSINKVNLLEIFPGGDPFKPNLFGYKAVKGPEAPPLQPNQPGAGAIQQTSGEVKTADATRSAMPSVIGLGHAEAIALLQRLGVPKENIKFQMGPVTDKPELRYRVFSQSPTAKEAIEGGKVTLVLHVFEADVKKQQSKPAERAK